MSEQLRGSGVFLPISALPSPYGIGSLGKEAMRFIDFLSDSGFSYWCIFPISFIDMGNGPASVSLSSEALDYGLIDLDELVNEGLVKESDLSFLVWNKTKTVNFPSMRTNKLFALKIAYRRFKKGGGDYHRGYATFLRKNSFANFATYMLLKEKQGQKPWNQFTKGLNQYSPRRVNAIIREYGDEYEFYLWTQYVLLRQWDRLRQYAHEKNIRIISEMPFSVSYDSMDVYQHPRNYCLDHEGKMLVSLANPPSVWSPQGRIWNRPYYSFPYLKRKRYNNFSERLNFYSSLYDYVVLDDFGDYFENYLVKTSSEDGIQGGQISSDGTAILDAMITEPGKVIAGASSVVTSEIQNYVQSKQMYSLQILQYAYSLELDQKSSPLYFNPHQISASSGFEGLTLGQSLSYLGDIDKKLFYSRLVKDCQHYRIRIPEPKDIQAQVNALLEINLASSSSLAVQSMFDLLPLASDHKGVSWEERLTEDDMERLDQRHLRVMNKRYNRC